MDLGKKTDSLTEPSNDIQNRAKTNFGQVVLGVISEIDPKTGLCTVNTFDPANDITGCVWLTKSFTAPLLGYRIKTIPSIGTQVVLLIGNPSFIIDVIDTPNHDELFGNAITKDGTFFREKYYQDTLFPGYEGSSSLLEGEFEIENAFNVGMAFLSNLITVRAGERAKIEAHLLHDMVRVIAEQYHNITPLGEVKIYDDGRPNMEVNFGSYVHELLNLASPNQDKVNNSEYHVNFDALDQNDPVKSFGHRFKTYIGFVGNFLNMFVSDPVTNINAIASGKAQFHIGNSGDILIRTVSEVAIERVVRVAVPVRNKTKTDPTGFLSKEFDELENSDILKKWNYGQGTGNTIHQCAYSLRSYARYLSNFASLMRFHQMAGPDNDKTFTVPKESDIPVPDMNNKEADLQDVNGAVSYIEGYSTIRIFRDGAVLTLDSTGGAVYHGRGIVEISAVKDVRIDSARDISLIAGRHMFFKAKQNIEFSSTEGGLVMKSRKLLNMLCELGKIWIKSDSTKGDENADYGVVIDSPNNKIFINSKDNTTIRQEEGDFLLHTIKGSAVMNSARNCVIKSKEDNVIIQANQKLVAKADNAFFDVKQFNIGNKFIIAGRDLLMKLKVFVTSKLVVRGNIHSRAVATKQSVYVPNCCDGTTDRVIIPGTYNHVLTLAGQALPSIPNEDINSLNTTVNNLLNKLNQEAVQFNTGKWSFQKPELELPADGSINAIFVPFSQDFIETNPSEFTDYIVWNFEQDKLKSAPRTDADSLPYPGDRVTEENFADFKAGEVLNKPSNKESKDWDQPEIKKRKIIRKVKP